MSGQPSPYELDVLPFVRPFTDALVASLRPHSIDRLLDHGAGTGEVIQRLRQAGMSGCALAVEPDAGMVARLRDHFSEEPATRVFDDRLANYVARITTDTTDMPNTRCLSDTSDRPDNECTTDNQRTTDVLSGFDVITSQLVLMFVEDPVAEL